MSIPSPGRLVITVDDTLGAALVGFSLSCVVFGVLSTQCFTYFRRYPMDRPAYKALVASLWLLEVIDQAFIAHVVYFFTISNFASPMALLTGDAPWTLIVQVLLGASVGAIVKLCFAMRVWRFSNKNVYVTATLLSLTLAQMGLAIAYAIRAFQLRKLTAAERLKLIATLALGSGALTDILTAAALTYFLRRLRTGYKKSDSIVNSLTIYAINTGAVTSAFSVCTLVMYNLNPLNFVFMAFYFVLSKLYAVSFLCTLNTRRVIRGRGTDREGNTSANTGTSGNTANIFGNTFYMVSHQGRTHTSPTRNVSLSQTKSNLEVGVHHEISIVSDVETPYSAGGYSDQAYSPVLRTPQNSYWR